MTCKRCNSNELLDICGKVSDRCSARYKNLKSHYEAPNVPGICSGDYIKFIVCLDCGQLQGTFPTTINVEFMNEEI